MKTIISPSLLSADFLNLKNEIQKFEKAKDIWFHLDIMDGHFVPNLTFGPTVVHNLKGVTEHKLDAHFMVTNPEDHIEWFKKSSIHNFTFHYESTSNPLDLINKIANNYQSVGISIKPKTSVEVLSLDILSNVNLVLVMSVEPGFGGQSFIPSALDKIQHLEKIRTQHSLNFQIQVDGGINNSTAKECINAGANNLVAGSYIFSSTNYLESINTLR